MQSMLEITQTAGLLLVFMVTMAMLTMLIVLYNKRQHQRVKNK